MSDTGLDAVPVIDVGPLVRGKEASEAVPVARLLDTACRANGFFYVIEHGVDEELRSRLEASARRFFAKDLDTKNAIRMARGGRAWRGYFPVGAELTSGRPDLKEGIYFGADLAEDDPRVAAGTPLHGRNLFPADPPELRDLTTLYVDQVTRLGHALARGLSLGLGLGETYLRDRYTRDPLVLFRIFHYPPMPADSGQLPWSVGEHTDYGLLTLLSQDDAGGLEVRSRSRWVPAPPIPGTLVCNIGDMLDRMTGGLYRSTPHRVRNLSGRGRISMPFFFDPAFEADVAPIDHGRLIADDRADRWDRASVHTFAGTYGDYLLGKVARVFPELERTALSSGVGPGTERSSVPPASAR
jgi:isopenicillin N synthase-like dioxygenase